MDFGYPKSAEKKGCKLNKGILRHDPLRKIIKYCKKSEETCLLYSKDLPKS